MTEIEVKVELLPIAYEDLDEIFDYILLDNPSAAEIMYEKIMGSFEHLKRFPNAGVRFTHSSLAHYHFRMMIVEPYIAFYRFIDGKVVVYRILHGARDIVQILKES
jgi:toxin ParE1/3/4